MSTQSVEAATSASAFYAKQGPISDPGRFSSLLDALPNNVAELVRVVQGLMIHVFWAERYGLTLDEGRKQEVQLRHVRRMLARIVALDDRPLSEPRPLERKLVGNCRDHSTLLASILRHKGVPARARCGFGTYFQPDYYEDHWVCEYWSELEKRWVMVDPQLDELQRAHLSIDFDTLDMPPGRFVTGGQAWRMCAEGRADPDVFGIFDIRGLTFIRGNVCRDLLSLAKLELLPWDCWGIICSPFAALSDDDRRLVDRMAELPDELPGSLGEIAMLCGRDERLRPPDIWPGS
jgi:Transglutaminase-like superfamily